MLCNRLTPSFPISHNYFTATGIQDSMRSVFSMFRGGCPLLKRMLQVRFGSTEYQVVTENKASTSFLSLSTEVRIMVYDYLIEDWPGLTTIHKGCVLPRRFRHTSYSHQRIDADCSISALTLSILLVSRQITSEALHVIRLSIQSLSSSIT